MNTRLPNDTPSRSPKPVPEIQQNDELAIDNEFKTLQQESDLEKKNRKMYWLGIIITLFYITSTIGIYALYMNMDRIFSSR